MTRPGGIRGRGCAERPPNRFESTRVESCDDGWHPADEDQNAPATTLIVDKSRSVITYNRSPDVPFDRSINPYRGCEHGCVYCFARPSHAWLGYSPGLDFETRLLYKPDAPALLRKELAARNYRCAPVALGINTDAYQPVERRLGLTRRILEVLAEARHPLSIVTKSALIERDLDLLAELAREELVHIALSVTTLDRGLSATLEPRAAPPRRRLTTIARLSERGIPVSLFFAPVIPMLNDHELERILEAGREAGARDAAYILLRLPHETGPLFEAYLHRHHPLKARRILERVRDSRGGKRYDARFGQRMSGTGPFADLLGQRFRARMKKLAFEGMPPLRCDLFRPPAPVSGQLALF